MAELPAPKEVTLSASPSIIYNNLVALGGDTVAYTHQQDVYFVRPLGPHKVALKEKDKAHITSVATARFQNRLIFVLTLNHETQLWDAQKEVQLAVVSHGGAEETRGCASKDGGNHLSLVIGHGTGEVEQALIGADFSVQVINRQKAHRGAITVVTSSARGPASYVSGDTSGEVHLWNDQLQSYASLPAQQDSVSAIQFLNEEWIAAGYGSGTIRIISARTGQLRCDVGAHSRWITAMSFSPVSNLLASVAEDNLLCLFRITQTPAGPKVEFAGYKIHPNRLPTGVVFSDDGKTATISIYDAEKLLMYPVA
jgi:hypothetical protein